MARLTYSSLISCDSGSGERILSLPQRFDCPVGGHADLPRYAGLPNVAASRATHSGHKRSC